VARRLRPRGVADGENDPVARPSFLRRRSDRRVFGARCRSTWWPAVSDGRDHRPRSLFRSRKTGWSAWCGPPPRLADRHNRTNRNSQHDGSSQQGMVNPTENRLRAQPRSARVSMSDTHSRLLLMMAEPWGVPWEIASGFLLTESDGREARS
jgi:hypothetical protein